MPRDELRTDDSRWPIVVHTTIGIPSDAQVDRFIAIADHHLARGVPYVVIFDSSQAGRVSPYMRGRAREWLASSKDVFSQHCLGTALVFKSAALRFVMSGVMLVASHPVPHEVCADLEEALRWSQARLDEHRRRIA